MTPIEKIHPLSFRINQALIIVQPTSKGWPFILQVLELELLEGALELKGGLVEMIVRHWRTGVHAHIERLRGCERGGHRPLNLADGRLLTIKPKFEVGRCRSLERRSHLHGDRHVACRRGSDFEFKDKTKHHNIPGLKYLAQADCVIWLSRFMQLPDEQMQHFHDYFDSGKPLIALRTANHGFWGGKTYEKNGKRV